MDIASFDNSSLKSLFCGCIDRRFPLSGSGRNVSVLGRDNNLSLEYEAGHGRVFHESSGGYCDATHLLLGLRPDHIYIHSIRLDESHRGKGFGECLYSVAEDFACIVGVDRVQQTPVGRTCTGEDRWEYLLRRG